MDFIEFNAIESKIKKNLWLFDKRVSGKRGRRGGKLKWK